MHSARYTSRSQKLWTIWPHKNHAILPADFFDGLLAIEDYPQEFSRPAKHLYPLNYSVVIYIQHIVAGVCVGHA
ncbi:hypothetical protein Bca101_027002 [Brassica carinata]